MNTWNRCTLRNSRFLRLCLKLFKKENIYPIDFLQSKNFSFTLLSPAVFFWLKEFWSSISASFSIDITFNGSRSKLFWCRHYALYWETWKNFFKDLRVSDSLKCSLLNVSLKRSSRRWIERYFAYFPLNRAIRNWFSPRLPSP